MKAPTDAAAEDSPDNGDAFIRRDAGRRAAAWAGFPMAKHAVEPDCCSVFENAKQIFFSSRNFCSTLDKTVPENNRFYFWQSGRGGSSLLVSGEGKIPAATSAVCFNKHLEAFLSGKRN